MPRPLPELSRDKYCFWAETKTSELMLLPAQTVYAYRGPKQTGVGVQVSHVKWQRELL